LQAMAHQHPQTGSGSRLYKIYNIGNNQSVELEQFITCIENTLGKKTNEIYLPMQDGDVVRAYADVNALGTATDSKPKTDLQIGIKQFFDWLKSYN
jgi:UDP-glucuronate 4-epimerase